MSTLNISHVTLPKLELTSGRKTAIFLTMSNAAASASGSLLEAICRNEYTYLNLYDTFFKLFGARGRVAPRMIRAFSPQFPKFGHVILLRGNNALDERINLSDYKLVFTLRDPRDLICSAYYNPISHEHVDESVRKDRQAMGIEKFVLAHIESVANMYEKSIETYCRQEDSSRLFLSYYDFMNNTKHYIMQLASFLEIDLEESGIESLTKRFSISNPSGIRYQHANAFPHWGRHKVELSGSTIKVLNNALAPYLRFLYEVESDNNRDYFKVVR